MPKTTRQDEPATYKQRKLLVLLSHDGRYWDEPLTKGEAGRNISILMRKVV